MRHLDILILTLLVFLILPMESDLEFGAWLGDLAKTSDGWSSFFETSLVKNPLAALWVALSSFLLLIYGFASFGVIGRAGQGMAAGIPGAGTAGAAVSSPNVFSLLVRRLVLAALVLLWVGMPLHWETSLRFDLGPKGHAHDGGVIQTEEAARFFLLGENPYAADYRSTPMATLEWGPKNPAILHLPYLPFSFLAHVPFLSMAEGAGFRYDARYLYLVFYLVGGFFAARFSRDPERRHLLAIVWYLNPFLVPHLVQGRNDVMVLTLVVVAIALLRAGRVLPGVLLFGVACATKQFAVLLVPFFVLFAVGRGITPRKLLPGILAAAVLVGPFFLWGPGAFWEDTVDFNTGRAEISYPLGGTPGYGLGNFANVFAWVENRYDYFPFWIVQAPMVLVAFALLFRWIGRSPSARRFFAAGALFLLTFLFFGRIFHLNYWGPVFAFFALAVFTEENPLSESRRSFESPPVSAPRPEGSS